MNILFDSYAQHTQPQRVHLNVRFGSDEIIMEFAQQVGDAGRSEQPRRYPAQAHGQPSPKCAGGWHSKTKLGERSLKTYANFLECYPAYEYSERFKLLQQISGWVDDAKRIECSLKVRKGYVHADDSGLACMSNSDLQAWINANTDSVGKI